ncbi:7-acetyl-epi-neemfruitin B aldo-keto reductase-like [Tasmannia lanceolata]|uniref:7-acetyl-epi-neemfruitin B aldo-keto reductase-like n=1 Tax=Tasmannia lanceolata TaxID=3420 RepID=UPI00406420C0
MGRIPSVVLNSGWSIPLVGMGTATYPIPTPDLVEESIIHAIELGYRHFDSASIYQSEKPLGQAISEALRRNLVSSRDELFITSKLACADSQPDLVLPALHKSLQALGLQYLDLYLIHFPGRVKCEKGLIFTKEDVLPFDMKGTWEAMEECHRLGLAKSIGVSNFTCKKMALLLAHSNISPAVNQVEMHPLWQQKKLRDFCEEKGIHVSAYSPLGGYGALWGSNLVLESEELKQIAQAKGKSVAQVCLRWVFEQGVSLLPKSFNKERMKENLEIFDWPLSEEELQKISLLPQQRLSRAETFVTPKGQYKSLEDLWDGEI